MESALLYYYVGSAIVAVTSGLVGFLLKHYRSSIEKPQRTFLAYIAGTIRLRLGAIFSKVLASQLSAKRYAQIALARSPSKLTIPSVQNVQLNLDTAYVRLSVTAGDRSKIPDSNLLVRPPDREIRSVLVFGEPGSGKSTLTRKLFRESCLYLSLSPSSAPLPVHIELRKLPWHEIEESEIVSSSWLQDIISREIDSVKGVHSDGFIFRAYSSGQGLILFLDGLDEVPSNSVDAACAAISETIKDLAGRGASTMTIILTCRSQLRAFLPRSFIEDFSEVTAVESFSPADIFQFLQRWPFRSFRTKEASRIFRAIQSSASLQEMCTNPLVLSMYVARDQIYTSRAVDSIRQVRLPDTRTEFYQEIINELLLFRRGEQVPASVVGSQLKRKRETALGRIALAHLLDNEQPANSIPWELAIDRMKEQFQIDDVGMIEREIRRFAIETGIFSEERVAESIRFLHLTICEFLAAIELRELGGDALEKVARAVMADQHSQQSSRLIEVLVFGSSLVGRTVRQDTIRILLAGEETPILPALRIIYENHEVLDGLLDAAAARLLELMAEDRYIEIDSCLRLLFLCIKAQCQPASFASEGPRDKIAELVTTLVDERRLLSFDHIFRVYLDVNPDVAILEAQARRLHRLLKPGLLAEALENPDVVESAIDAFQNAPQVWGLALAEAALRHRLVAETLLEVPSNLKSTAVPRTWSHIRLLGGTLYGDVLDYAAVTLLGEKIDPLALPKLHILFHYGSHTVIPMENAVARQVLNLDDRLLVFPIRNRNVIIEVPWRDRSEVWGDPSAVHAGQTDTRAYVEKHPGVHVVTFGPDGRSEPIGHYLVNLLSFEGPLSYLSNFTAAYSVRGKFARTLRLRPRSDIYVSTTYSSSANRP